MKRTKIFAFLLLLVFASTVFSGCADDSWSKWERIPELTGVVIPADTKVVYHFYDNNFIHGRHAQYSVYKFEEEPNEWLQTNGFSSDKNKDIEKFFQRESGFHQFVDKFLKGNLPDEYQPDFDNTYYWLKVNGIYFLYFPEKLMLMVYVDPT